MHDDRETQNLRASVEQLFPTFYYSITEDRLYIESDQEQVYPPGSTIDLSNDRVPPILSGDTVFFGDDILFLWLSRPCLLEILNLQTSPDAEYKSTVDDYLDVLCFATKAQLFGHDGYMKHFSEVQLDMLCRVLRHHSSLHGQGLSERCNIALNNLKT